MDDQQVDVTGVDVVEVKISATGDELWINIDGVCRLHIAEIKALMLSKGRASTDTP